MNFKFNDIKIRHKILIKKGKLFLPNTGVVIFKGNNGTGKSLLLNRLHLEDSKATVLVSQFCEVIPNLSALENISMNINSKKHGKVVEFIKRYNLEYLLNLKVTTMSGGEKRLVSLLRGVLSDSSIVLLDEPTNDLDYKTTNKV